MVNLAKVKNIYLIGIGGSGMSSIANLMIDEGKSVSGSDKNQTLTTKELEKRGVIINPKQNAKNISRKIELVVFTVAIPKDNPELMKAKRLRIPCLSYPEIIGLISKEKTTIAVSGTHGKTTTTAMLAHILSETKINPTVIIGSKINNYNSNFIKSQSQYLLIEADEYRNSFLNLSPKYLIITNIDEDHLDFYKDLKEIQHSFIRLVRKIPKDGFLVCNKSSTNLKLVIKEAKCKVLDYSRVSQKSIKLKLPGLHNRRNASAAFMLAKKLGVKEDAIMKRLKTFSGVSRRFEYKGKTKNGALVYDDYAHNPQKVTAALQGAREKYPNKKITAIFQPHLFSRTKTLLKEFGTSFTNADQVILLPIYGAREKFDKSISSETLAKEIGKNGTKVNLYSPNNPISNKKNDILVFLGAGDITNLTTSFIHNPSSNIVH